MTDGIPAPNAAPNAAPSAAPSPGASAAAPSALADLPSGSTARLVRVEGARAFRRRLMELGLLPGTEVRVVRRAPLGGVVEIEVRRCRLSLRLTEAAGLFVEPNAGGGA